MPTPPRTRGLWLAFAAVHAWTAVVGIVLLRAQAFGDVELYRLWVLDGLRYGLWPVLDTAWVYPVGALAPIAALAPWTGSPVGFAVAWAVLVTALNAGAVVVLLRTTPHGTTGAWWWLAATLALGPVAIGRLDGLVAPVTAIALALAARRPRVAAALITAAAWIKVAPGVVLLPLAATTRRWARDVVAPAAVVSGAVVGVALLAGAGGRVGSFLGTQGARGLQVEAVAATPVSLARWWNPGITAEYNRPLNTFEFAGVDTTALTRALDLALPLAVAALAWLTWRAARRDDDGARPALPAPATGAQPAEALLLGALALSLALIVVNKVGSPQYVSWLLPPVAVALAVAGWAPAWRAPAIGLLAVAGLTQWLFPLDYVAFLWGLGPVVAVAAVRNVLLVALLGWATVRLWRAG